MMLASWLPLAPLLAQATPGAAPHPLSGSIAEWGWLLPLIPLLGAIVNGLFAIAPRLTNAGSTGSAEQREAISMLAHGRSSRLVSLVGTGVLLAAFGLAIAIFAEMVRVSPMATPFVRTYAQWMPAGSLVVDWGVQLDQLSILMALIITGVGSLIHIFSVGYMREDPGYARYFAYLNLFVAFMLVLVLGSSYPVLFVGWEGVGLCSYLLIGFWFGDKANADAGKKAFVVNRIGDFGFLVAMFLIWTTVGKLDFVGAHAALSQLSVGAPVLVAIALFLFLGCAGKSAQIPLYIWLPDAMAGPTPVSALIHAATMVTAGVYLVARAGAVFAAAPSASLVVATIGAVTAFVAATIALRQWDIKKVLAYSTVSQLGYMFIGVGTGAYAAGVFHLVTHAFFKALLFLGAGSVIHVLHHAYHHTHRDDQDAQDLRNMGGLRRYMPVTAAAMGLGTLAIIGIPPFAGFFSKDEILSSAFARAQGSPLANASLLGIPGSVLLYAIYAIGLVTALLTAVYMTRMFLLAFMGDNRTGAAEASVLHEAPAIMTAPVVVLALLAAAGGWLNLPTLIPLGPAELLTHWLEPVTGSSAHALAGNAELAKGAEQWLIAIAVAVGVIGIVVAWSLSRRPVVAKDQSPADIGVNAMLANAYHVDGALDAIVVRPLNGFATNLLWRAVDTRLDGALTGGASLLVRSARRVGAKLQGGDVGSYAWLVAAGALLMLAALTLS